MFSLDGVKRMLFFDNSVKPSALVRQQAEAVMNNKDFLEQEIRTWKYSPERLFADKRAFVF